MKASCLKPTDKNLLDTFENDYIGRKTNYKKSRGG